MAMPRQPLYYDGYDPAWVIGTGKPAPVRMAHVPPQLLPPTMVPNLPIQAVPPFMPVQANGILPPAQLPLSHKKKSHGGNALPFVQTHGHTIGKSNLAPMTKSQVHVAGLPAVGMVGTNPNPYAPSPVIQNQSPRLLSNAPGPPARVVLLPETVVAGALPSKGAVVLPAAGARGVINPIIKVVMWVPLCCDACEKKWKDGVTDLEGFEGFDVERRLERVSVFGHSLSPTAVLATIQKVVSRAQMWRL
ncbi:hypothetical protein MPTK1_2g25900 [Marchantia polymorpha subsp. ruderalis]|nr:hypothetical protein MARPO_0025s0089 [Marchantia polymorpha]BBN03728.1 hypothetical protein Mp_2g25900 [Marchantia polymorpha subsp. ruderalis]|eukprot:PTQ43405.1 hypothetical protein MARPO_0025s0089 [Marchantia polymorpha]